jgi:hypothetical protein
MTEPLTIAYRGNFLPWIEAEGRTPWSTEYHVARSLELLGHRVVRVQEDQQDWRATEEAAADADLFLWTSTPGYAAQWDKAEAFRSLARLGRRMPTVGYHLDLWFGLERDKAVHEEPFFQALGWVFTADGDHQAEFAAAGVNHLWCPPAVFGPECVPGTPREKYAVDVAFVGSWLDYHPAWWPDRKRMLDFLKLRYRKRCRFFPDAGQPAVRSEDLNDLYASAKVIVGDSCFADRSTRYFSDRVFETVGRGGFLIHQRVPAVADMLGDGAHLRLYRHGDHEELGAIIDHYLEHVDARDGIRKAGQEHVAANHTYAHRLADVLATVLG